MNYTANLVSADACFESKWYYSISQAWFNSFQHSTNAGLLKRFACNCSRDNPLSPLRPCQTHNHGLSSHKERGTNYARAGDDMSSDHKMITKAQLHNPTWHTWGEKSP